MGSKLLPDICDRLEGEDCSAKHDKLIDVKLVADKDVGWTKIVDEYCTRTDNSHITKIDDVNHALKPTFKCVSDVKTESSSDERRDSGLTVTLAKHLYRSA